MVSTTILSHWWIFLLQLHTIVERKLQQILNHFLFNDQFHIVTEKKDNDHLNSPIFLSFLPSLSPWRFVRSYDFIWDKGLHLSDGHKDFVRRSPSWGFPGFFSAVRQMPGDPRTDQRFHFIITLIISLETNWHDTRGIRSQSWWYRHINVKFFDKGHYSQRARRIW